MNEGKPRKKSPRAPSISLDDAIERAVKVYQKETRHPAPTDVVAQDLGYKSANNGAALAVLASLRYFGLLERPQEGQLAVSKNVETYQYDEDMRRELIIGWLKTPVLFSELLEKYESGLPSDAKLRYDLIQRGFNPASAEDALSVFKRSVDFAKYYERRATLVTRSIAPSRSEVSDVSTDSEPAVQRNESELKTQAVSAQLDRIPVRLAGGRRAWLEIPTPFYSSDKDRLKAQIDLLLTEDEVESNV